MDTHHLYTICMDKPFPLCIDTSYSTSLHTPLSILYGHPPPLHYLYGQTLPPLYRHVIQYIITHTPVYSVWTPTTSTLFVWTHPSPAYGHITQYIITHTPVYFVWTPTTLHYLYGHTHPPCMDTQSFFPSIPQSPTYFVWTHHLVIKHLFLYGHITMHRMDTTQSSFL